MPEDFAAAPMLLTVFTQGFEEINYTIPLDGPFGATAPLTAIELEARAKSCAVMIQVALVPLDEIYGDQPETPEGEENVE